MSRLRQGLLGLAVVLLATSTTPAEWVNFVDQTGSRLDAPNNLVLNDDREKDYAWADIDKDGDMPSTSGTPLRRSTRRRVR